MITPDEAKYLVRRFTGCGIYFPPKVSNPVVRNLRKKRKRWAESRRRWYWNNIDRARAQNRENSRRWRERNADSSRRTVRLAMRKLRLRRATETARKTHRK